MVVKAREFTDWYGRTSHQYGFTLAGICLKDPITGEVEEKKYKLHP